jgi:hypothetical protein
MYRIIASLYPNNELRIVKSQSPAERTPAPCNESGEVPCEFLTPPDFELWSKFKKNSPPLSLGPNSKTQRSSAGYGNLPVKPSSFGLNAKRTLIRSGAALETVAPPEECLFITGTLPGSTEAAYRSIAAYSGYIVNSLKAWIALRVPQKLDFYCWEYQKRGALHLHYCCHIPNGSDRDYFVREFKRWWIDVLHRIGERSHTDMFRKNAAKTWLSDTSKVRAEAEICKKSPARYLAKYLSKSAAPARGPARAFTPARWWGTSRPLKSLLNSLTSVVHIAEGGYHAIRSMWEKVKHEWATCEGVTHSFVHKFGMGETLLVYPHDPNEAEALCYQMEVLSTIRQKLSTSGSLIPSQVLKMLRNRLVVWLRESLTNLSESHQGLRLCLENYLNMMLRITPSTSTEPLAILLYWAAEASDIRSLCQFTPVWTPEGRSLLNETLDTLEAMIETVARDGWS